MEQTIKGRVQATVFGLDVGCDVPLRFLEHSAAKPTGRTLDVSVRPGEQRDADWPESAELVCDERQTDGSVIFRIWSDPDQGYLISGPGYGSHRLSVDGRRLRCAPEGSPDYAWQRLLIAQVLPFATLLQGLEVFHASAIVHDGDAVAFLGRSRTGKTSLALELCGRGSSFLADDVLALESRQGSLLAHPGTPIAGVDRAAADHAHAAHTIRAKDVLAVNARERLVAMRAVGEAKPLARLFFLERHADGPKQPRFEATEDVQLLLGATFNFVLVTPERLRGLLEACALAARLRVERVVFGSATDVSELAGAVERRLSRQA